MGDNEICMPARVDGAEEISLAGGGTPAVLNTEFLTAIPSSDTVDVSLARRIITPGSNRVLCLAAQTTVPIAGDETSSVTDLRLKLSDGTNVVLSLSCFNDALLGAASPSPVMATASAGGRGGGTAAIITVQPAYFDPEKYKVRSEPHLSRTIIAILAGLALGAYVSIQAGDMKKLSTKFAAALGSSVLRAPKQLSVDNAISISQKSLIHKTANRKHVHENIANQSFSGSQVQNRVEKNRLRTGPKFATGFHKSENHLVAKTDGKKNGVLLTNKKVLQPEHSNKIGAVASKRKHTDDYFVPPPPPTSFELGAAPGYQWQLVPTGATGNAFGAGAALPPMAMPNQSPLLASEPKATASKRVEKTANSANRASVQKSQESSSDASSSNGVIKQITGKSDKPLPPDLIGSPTSPKQIQPGLRTVPDAKTKLIPPAKVLPDAPAKPEVIPPAKIQTEPHTKPEVIPPAKVPSDQHTKTENSAGAARSLQHAKLQSNPSDNSKIGVTANVLPTTQLAASKDAASFHLERIRIPGQD